MAFIGPLLCPRAAVPRTIWPAAAVAAPAPLPGRTLSSTITADLSISHSVFQQEVLNAEVLDMARRLGATGMKLLVIDTGEVAHMWQYSHGEVSRHLWKTGNLFGQQLRMRVHSPAGTNMGPAL